MLLARAGERIRDGDELHKQLERALPDAWPQLVLGLRSECRSGALFVLAHACVAEAAPFFLSLIRHPVPDPFGEFTVRCAEAYVATRKPDAALVDEFVPYLDRHRVDDPVEAGHSPSATVPSDWPAHALTKRRYTLGRAAMRLLAGFTNDERVLLGVADTFVWDPDVARRLLAKHKSDPRVVSRLHEQLAEEEKEARARANEKMPLHSDEYGELARFLARAGDPLGAKAAQDYKKYSAWLRRKSL